MICKALHSGTTRGSHYHLYPNKNPSPKDSLRGRRLSLHKLCEIGTYQLNCSYQTIRRIEQQQTTSTTDQSHSQNAGEWQIVRRRKDTPPKKSQKSSPPQEISQSQSGINVKIFVADSGKFLSTKKLAFKSKNPYLNSNIGSGQ